MQQNNYSQEHLRSCEAGPCGRGYQLLTLPLSSTSRAHSWATLPVSLGLGMAIRLSSAMVCERA